MGGAIYLLFNNRGASTCDYGNLNFDEAMLYCLVSTTGTGFIIVLILSLFIYLHAIYRLKHPAARTTIALIMVIQYGLSGMMYLEYKVVKAKFDAQDIANNAQSLIAPSETTRSPSTK